ncbi:uncharacterized protein [Ambystoma mexicanum]|uniref:uncharacterized protein n=1 Tax=Ambystoma mexicanum TaxID=8296 RepID=UPI0037E77C42
MIDAIIEAGLAEGNISQKEADFLSPRNPKCPPFYALPKIHKNTTPIRGRPIVSGIGSKLESVSQFADFFLKDEVTHMKSYTKDTTAVLNYLENLVLPNNEIYIVTMDIESLYSRIPQGETLKVIEKTLHAKRPEIQIPIVFIMQFAEIALTKNYFLLDNRFFEQISGTAMGAIRHAKKRERNIPRETTLEQHPRKGREDNQITAVFSHSPIINQIKKEVKRLWPILNVGERTLDPPTFAIKRRRNIRDILVHTYKEENENQPTRAGSLAQAAFIQPWQKDARPQGSQRISFWILFRLKRSSALQDGLQKTPALNPGKQEEEDRQRTQRARRCGQDRSGTEKQNEQEEAGQEQEGAVRQHRRRSGHSGRRRRLQGRSRTRGKGKRKKKTPTGAGGTTRRNGNHLVRDNTKTRVERRGQSRSRGKIQAEVELRNGQILQGQRIWADQTRPDQLEVTRVLSQGSGTLVTNGDGSFLLESMHQNPGNVRGEKGEPRWAVTHLWRGGVWATKHKRQTLDEPGESRKGLRSSRTSAPWEPKWQGHLGEQKGLSFPQGNHTLPTQEHLHGQVRLRCKGFGELGLHWTLRKKGGSRWFDTEQSPHLQSHFH